MVMILPPICLIPIVLDKRADLFVLRSVDEPGRMSNCTLRTSILRLLLYRCLNFRAGPFD